MRSLLKTIGNAALVVGGFFVVFFGVSKFTKDEGGSALPGYDADASALGDRAFADAPYSQSYYQSYYQDYYQSSYGDCGDCGGDCGGCK